MRLMEELMLQLGVIGYGNRARSVIRGMLRFREGLRVAAKGKHPAGLKCIECAERNECPQSTFKSVAPLEAGLLSVLMCLKAKRSAETRSFQEIAYPVS